MATDPRDEQCPGCGRDSDECVCGLAPDLSPLDEFENPSDAFYVDDWAEEEE